MDLPFLRAVPVTEGLWSIKWVFWIPWTQTYRHSCVLLSSHPLACCYFFQLLSISVCPCMDTALILSLQLSLDPHELMLPKRGDQEEEMWSSVLWCVLGSSNSVWFPWKRPEKYGAEVLRECSTPMSLVQVKSKPASVALQAPPWNSLFRLFSCVATRSVHRAKGEWAFQRQRTWRST